MKKKILISSIAMIALCLCIIAGSTFALFTDEASVSIAVTAGDLDVTAEIIGGTERMVSLGDYTSVEALTPAAFVNTAFDNGGSAILGTGPEADGGNGLEAGKLFISGMTPGDGVCFQVRVENTGDVALQYTVKATPGQDTDNFYSALDVIVYDENGAALANNTYAEVGGAGEFTTFYVAVVFPNSFTEDQNVYQGATVDINFTIEVVQANGVVNGQILTGN